MSYKKLIPFINGENELAANVVTMAEDYCFAGADELFLYNYSKITEEREEFLATLKEIDKKIDIPFIVGMYAARFEDVKKASKLIRWNGFTLGHQMMVGLPESSRADEINTAKALVKLKPKMVRIYPVLVVKNTKLEQEYENGTYEPLSVVQAVEICKELVRIFDEKNINVIRIGLQNTEEISDPKNSKSEVVAGPYHPAFRQLVESGMWYDAIVSKIKKLNVKAKKVEVTVNPIDINNVIGHKKENVIKLNELYNVDLIVKQDKNIKQGKSKIEVIQTYEN